MRPSRSRRLNSFAARTDTILFLTTIEARCGGAFTGVIRGLELMFMNRFLSTIPTIIAWLFCESAAALSASGIFGRRLHAQSYPRDVGPPLDVALQCPGIGAGAEAPAGPGHHDDPDGSVGGGPRQQGPVLGVHPSRPGVEAVGPAQSDGGDGLGRLVAGDFQLVELHVLIPIGRSHSVLWGC